MPLFKVDVKMTTAQGTVIWRDIVEVKEGDRDGYAGIWLILCIQYVEYLQEHLLKVVRRYLRKCIEKLGFDTHDTYLLEEDYIKKSRYKINIADKLNELNVLRHENLISEHRLR